MQILITGRDDITPLLGMEWMKKFNLTSRNIRTDENNQSEKKRRIDCFVSPVVITVKNTKSVKIALDLRKLNDSCTKIRPRMPKSDELLNQISEVTRDRTKELNISKIDLDYAYGQLKISKETNRQCVFALTGGEGN